MKRENHLEIEQAFFEEMRAEYCKDHLDKFVLIKNRETFGFFQTEEDALEAGIAKYGIQPFLIKKIVPEEPVLDMTSYFLGLHHATV